MHLVGRTHTRAPQTQTSSQSARTSQGPQPSEFERRAAAGSPMGPQGHREQTTLKPSRIG